MAASRYTYIHIHIDIDMADLVVVANSPFMARGREECVVQALCIYVYLCI